MLPQRTAARARALRCLLLIALASGADAGLAPPPPSPPPSLPPAAPPTLASLRAQLTALSAQLATLPVCSGASFLQRTVAGVWACTTPVIQGGGACRAATGAAANAGALVVCDATATPQPPPCAAPGSAWLGYNGAAGGWVCVCVPGWSGAACDIVDNNTATQAASCAPPACSCSACTGMYRFVAGAWTCDCVPGFGGPQCSPLPSPPPPPPPPPPSPEPPVPSPPPLPPLPPPYSSRFCDASDDVSQCQALFALTRSTSFSTWSPTVASTWLNGSYCTWTGVTCAVGTRSVTGLALSGANLQGSLPSEFGDLTALQTLFIDEYWLTGTLPDTMARLGQLESFSLTSTFGGTLAVLGNFTQLTALSINNYNGYVSGVLPQLSSRLTSLSLQWLGQVTGSLSFVIGLSNLTSLSLFKTGLSGDVPAAACPTLNGVTSCSLAGNQMTCNLPSCLTNIFCSPQCSVPASATSRFCGAGDDLSQCNALVNFALATAFQSWSPTVASTWLNGSYCTWTGVTCAVGTRSVTGLALSGANLQGSLPSEFGDLTALQTLFINEYWLTGTLPDTMARLGQLESFSLTSTFGGTLAVLGNFTQLTALSINNYNGYVSGVLPQLSSRLTSLSLQWLGQVTGSLSPTSPLTSLALYNSKISVDEQSLAACTSLTSLTINGLSNVMGTIPSTLCPVLNNLTQCSLTGNSLLCPLPWCLNKASCDPNSCLSVNG